MAARAGSPRQCQRRLAAGIVFLFKDGDRVEPHEYRISLLHVTLAELRERLELAGLREVGTDFAGTSDYYVVIAVAA
jgi:hypothetical protein